MNICEANFCAKTLQSDLAALRKEIKDDEKRATESLRETIHSESNRALVQYLNQISIQDSPAQKELSYYHTQLMQELTKKWINDIGSAM